MEFETGLPIGRGASGEVFKVWDPRLERHVALKVLRRDDPRTAARMLAEARAQARVEHPNVCRVYEVGERDGRPCLVLQYVDGVPLDRAAADLGLEERVALVATIAEAVAAAHAVGLIHRDLKPGNLLVERDADGRPVPYVLDFGLAQEIEAPDATLAGQVLGTPGYLAPEQARGDLAAIDRRSDVFALGIVLYELLVGESPFAAPSAAESLVRVLESEPAPPRERQPGLPRDLDTIVRVCLEKDPERRYGSARELALDLRRWLAGEPISVRPPSGRERLGRAMRRHPVAAAALAVAALAILAGAALAGWSAWRGAERARWAQRFGARAERSIVAQRMAFLLPLHDVRPARARAEAEIEALRAEAARLGPGAEGAARFAIGRLLEALGRHTEARRELERAIEAGNDDGRVRLARGRVLAALWLEARDRAARLRDPELRAEALAATERELGVPAWRTLEQVPEEIVEVHEAHYLEGLLHLLAEDPARAREAALAAAAAAPWFYEGELLAAEALLSEAVSAIGGGRSAEALRALDEAEGVARRAAAKGSSDPAVWRLAGDVARWRFELARSLSRASEAEPAWSAAVAAYRQALTADPGDPEALDRLAEVSWKQAQARAEAGLAPAEALALARGAATRLAATGRSGARAEAHLGNAAWVEARWTGDHGGAPQPLLERAAAHLVRAVDEDPDDAYLHLSLGHVLNQLAVDLADRGADFLPIADRAVAAYRRGIGQPGAFASRLWNGICATESDAAYYLSRAGRAAGDRFERAIEACTAALESAPGYRAARNNLALARWGLALARLWRTGSAEAELAQARHAFEELLGDFPERVALRVNLVGVRLDELEWGPERDALSWRAGLEDIEELLAPVESVFPGDYHHYRARIERLRAVHDPVHARAERDRRLALAESAARAALATGEFQTYRTELVLVLLHRAALAGHAPALARARAELAEARAAAPDDSELAGLAAIAERLSRRIDAGAQADTAGDRGIAELDALVARREDLLRLAARLGV